MLGYFTSFDNDLFDQFDLMRREVDRLLEGGSRSSGIRSMASGTFPAINMGVSPERVDIYVFAAGVDPKSMDISIQQNLLKISGERKSEKPEGVEFYRNERFTGAFSRTLTLPEDVDPDKVNASYHDGVLQITVQRREEVVPRRIEVK